jgi:hypothetical protein
LTIIINFNNKNTLIYNLILTTLVYLCIDQNFHVSFIICLINVYILKICID